MMSLVIMVNLRNSRKKLINEINELNVDGMPKVEKLNALVGKYVNLEYQLPNGQVAKFLN